MFLLAIVKELRRALISEFQLLAIGLSEFAEFAILHRDMENARNNPLHRNYEM